MKFMGTLPKSRFWLVKVVRVEGLGIRLPLHEASLLWLHVYGTGVGLGGLRFRASVYVCITSVAGFMILGFMEV